MTMKRCREDEEEKNAKEVLGKPNNLMLLYRVYECKTCSRKFSSFQALGGHQTRHKKLKLNAGDVVQQVAVKPKTHKCSICGVDFPLGQALGGHMRRHRAAVENSTATTTSRRIHDDLMKTPPVLKRFNSSKRVLCLDLTLRSYEIDLTLKL